MKEATGATISKNTTSEMRETEATMPEKSESIVGNSFQSNPSYIKAFLDKKH